MTRAIFRSFIRHLKKGEEIIMLIKRGHKEYVEILQWAKGSKTIYKTKKQKERVKRKNHQQEQIKNDAQPSLFSLLSYKQKKENVEKFFNDYRLRELFRVIAPKIKQEGYTVSIKRRNNRVDCKPAVSEPSSLSKSVTVGYLVA